jgi:hypothetical protein
MINTIEINDTKLVAGLMSRGYNPTERFIRGREVYFVFEKDQELDNLIDRFSKNDLEVDALSYALTMKSVKQMVWNALDRNE